MDGAGPPNRAGDAQHLQFCLTIQPIAGLYLDGGDPFGDQCVGTAQGRRQQVGLAAGAGRLDCGHDTATRAGDFFVAGPFKAHLEFRSSVAAVNDMRVTVDQGGGHKPPVKAAYLKAGILGRQVRDGPDPRDFVGLNHKSCIREQPVSGPVI